MVWPEGKVGGGSLMINISVSKKMLKSATKVLHRKVTLKKQM